MRIRIIAIAVLVALAAIPVALGAHTDTENDPDAPGECTFDADETTEQRWVADARGHDVVCVDIVGIEPFSPAVLVIDAGTTVVWRNQHGVQHTTTATLETGADSFQHVLAPGDHAWTTFEASGEYYYDCRSFFPVHASAMHGKIVVE